jgi:hypothetical protein
MGGVFVGRRHVGHGAVRCGQDAKEVGKQVLEKGGQFLEKKLSGPTETEKVKEVKKKKNAVQRKK